MKKMLAVFLFSVLPVILFSCSPDSGGNGDAIISGTPHGYEEGALPDGPDIDSAAQSPAVSEDEAPQPAADPTGGLERGSDRILIGSAVLDEPVLLMGMGVDPVVVINVRDGPSLEANRLTTIGRGEVVEATEIVDGWYSVVVFASMTEGYIRSDLLVPYAGPGSVYEPPDDETGANIFTGTDPSGLMRGSDGVLIGSVEFQQPMMLMGMSSSILTMINVREFPDIDAQRVRCPWGTVTVGKGQMVEAFGVEDGWYRVRVHPGLFYGYIRSDLLVPFDENRMYYADNVSGYDTRMSAAEQLIAEGTLVDLRTIADDIEYCMIFATPDNFTGMTQYSRDVPILQYGTALKLKEAQELFKQDGYRIKLYDAYRPSSVSGRLSAIIPDRNYIARAGTSIHNRAAAVDMTLVDTDGNELEMPSPMHTFNSTSHRNSSSMSSEAKANMDYMTNIMKQAGMTGIISSEWWHFGDSEASSYLPIDIEFREFTFSIR